MGRIGCRNIWSIVTGHGNLHFVHNGYLDLVIPRHLQSKTGREVGPRHANVSRAKEITQSYPRWLAQDAKRAKLTIGSQNLPAYAEGHYHDKDPYCDAAVVLVAPQHKNRPLEHCRFGGTGTLFALSACPKEIC